MVAYIPLKTQIGLPQLGCRDGGGRRGRMEGGVCAGANVRKGAHAAPGIACAVQLLCASRKEGALLVIFQPKWPSKPQADLEGRRQLGS